MSSRGIEPKGAVVVVTGAGSGIGAATARRYGDEGARVVVCADIDLEAATRTAEACANGIALACDVADASAVDRLAREVAERHGEADIVVNNAGVGVGGPFLNNSQEDWEWLRGVNLDGVVHGCRIFGERMVARRRGQIVNVASSAAYIPNRRMATYCATKAAVVMLTRCLRADWASDGVGASAICPGVINTPILGHTRLRGISERERSRIATGFRFGHSPDAVARAIVGAARHDRAVVNVGIETELVHHALRLTPGFLGLHDLVARA